MGAKVAIVTGGASLIGIASGRAFVAAGWRAVLADRNDEPGAEVRDALGPDGVFLAVDVTADDGLDRLVATALHEYGGVDAVVNAAAVFDDAGLDTTRGGWHDALDVNVVSAARLIAKAAPVMVERGGGAVVNVASVSATRSQPNRMVYNVTKAALVALTRNASQALAGSGIRVNSVSPGWTWSRNIEVRYGSRERADALGAEFQPLGRMADPSEVAAAVVFLASDEASFITGVDLPVDGGYSAIGPEALGQPFDEVPPLVAPTHRSEEPPR